MRLVVLLAVSLACSSKSTSPPAPDPDPAPPPVNEAPSPADAAPAPAGPIPSATRQLVLGVADDWDDGTIELITYERDADGYREIGRWPATIGHAGLGWGRGLHGDGAPDGRSGPVKAEGDGKSPAGVFSIGKAYGYSKSPPERSSVPYTQVDGTWRCVDDPDSAHYNKIVDESDVTVDWKSAEVMKRSDELYRWVVEIDHNLSATPKAGSCIFFHVWRGPEGSTVGCAAMEQKNIETLIAWLDPDKKPVAVLLTRDELSALRKPWALPK